MMKALAFNSIPVKQAGTTESNAGNIRSALARGLPEFAPAFCSHDGTFVIAASGASLPEYVQELKQEQEQGRPICAIKGAHDYLIDNGITPNLFVSVEPRDRPLKHISDQTVYMLASRTSPALFDQLETAKVILWHAWSAEPECEEWKGHYGVGGGTTSGLRAITLGFLLGFRKFVLYGFDSCLDKDRDTKRFTGEKVGDAWKLDIIVDGRRFWCNGALAQQATEFQELYKGMPNVTIEAKGDGLIAAILAARRKRGFVA